LVQVDDRVCYHVALPSRQGVDKNARPGDLRSIDDGGSDALLQCALQSLAFRHQHVVVRV
jgi:hypothetical protein